MNIDYKLNQLHAMLRETETLQEELRRSGGKGGGGRGGGDHMDQRIARLEGDYDRLTDKVDRISEKIGTLGEQLAAMKERLSQMPSRFEFYTVIVTATTLLGAIVLLAERLRSLA
jgi:archaellum component FlaC